MAAGPAKLASRALVVLIATFYFFAVLRLEIEPIGGDLDSSWSAVVAWALATGKHWGEQILFTYGPLGALHPASVNFPATFPFFLAAQTLMVAAAAWLFGSVASRIPLFWALVWFVLVVAWYPWIPGEISWLLVMPLALPALAGIDGGSKLRFVAAGLTLTTIALVKFNSIPVFAATLGAAFLIAVLDGKIRRAAAIAVVFPSAFLLGWFACGQTLGGLFDYVRYGLELSGGYSAAMQIGTAPVNEFVGLATFGVLLGFLALVGLHEWREGRWPVVALLIAFVAFVAWKSFYTRADGRIIQFYCFAALLPTVALTLRGSGTWLHVPAAAFALAATFAANFVSPDFSALAHLKVLPARIYSTAQKLADPAGTYRTRVDNWAAEAQKNDMPATRAVVGDKTVDLFMYRQRIALINGLNYSPRPVFQSYAAYTTTLARLNESYYLQPKSPDFTMTRFEGIDNRITMQEDGLAQIAILQRYRPVLVEKQFLLTRRDPEIPPPPAVTPPPGDAYRIAAFGKPIEVPDGGDDAVLVFLAPQPTLFGKLLNAAIREPVILVELTFDNGTRSMHRLVRLTAADGFVISPALATPADWISHYLRQPTQRVTSFQLIATSMLATAAFQPEIPYAFKKVPTLHVKDDEATEPLINAIYPGFNLIPDRRAGTIQVVDEEGSFFIQMQTPSSLRFTPGERPVTARGEFGLRNEALTALGCESNDGVTLRVTDSSKPDTPLFERHVNPRATPTDKGAQPFEFVAPAASADRRLLFEMLPGANPACDWGYVRNIRFTPVDAH